MYRIDLKTSTIGVNFDNRSHVFTNKKVPTQLSGLINQSHEKV